MNEKIFLKFHQDEKLVPVTQLHSDPEHGGVTLSNETSAFPRGFGLNIWPADPVTSEKVWRVQRRLDWQRRVFRVDLGRHRDRLVITGVDATALPAGRYDVEFMLGGMRFKRSQFRNVRLKEGGATDLVFEAKPSKFRFELNTKVAGFDAETQTILQDSHLDGHRADRWLQTRVKNRDVRKACLMNILSKLAIVPDRADRLNQFVCNVFHVEADRVYAKVAPGFLKEVRRGFLPADATIAATHKRLLREIREPQHYTLHSHREKKGNGALQAVVAVPKRNRPVPEDVLFADIDIDGSNPSYDLARFMMHVGHLVQAKTTDHFKMRKRIASQTGDFLYYDAVRV